MKRQIEIILLLLLVLGSIGINTVVVLILTVKTIISTILIDEIATLAIASFALAVEIIALPYILDLIRDSKYYSQAYTMRSWVNPKHLRTKIFSFSVFIIVILNFIGEKELLGNYLSYKGSGIYVYLALSSALCALIYYLSSKFMKSKTFLFFGHVFLYLMVISLLYLFKKHDLVGLQFIH